MGKTPAGTVNGVPMFVDTETGRWEATVGRDTVTRSTKAALIEEVAKRSHGVRALLVGYGYGNSPTWTVDDVVEYLGPHKWRARERGIHEGKVVLYDQTLVDALEAHRERERELSEAGYQLSQRLSEHPDQLRTKDDLQAALERAQEPTS